MTEQSTQSHPFLSKLDERHRTALASAAKTFTATPGELLAREGEPAKTFYLLQAGHMGLDLHVPGRGLVSIQTVGPGEIVGWSWLVPPHRWRFDCRAAETVEALAFDAEWLREKCEQDHELGYQLLKHLVTVMAGRLTATRHQLLELSK